MSRRTRNITINVVLVDDHVKPRLILSGFKNIRIRRHNFNKKNITILQNSCGGSRDSPCGQTDGHVY